MNDLDLSRLDSSQVISILNQAQLAQDKLDYEGSLSEFLKGAWPYIENAEYIDNWAIDAMAEHLEAVTYGQIRRLLINISPRCGKTNISSICWPAWTWAQRDKTYLSGPQVKFLCGSYNDKLTLTNSNKVRRLIMSPWYQKFWGDRFSLRDDENSKSKFDNTGGGGLIATSVRGTLLGMGGDVISVDDPHNTEDAESEAERITAERWWKEISSTRMNNPKLSPIVVNMQRLHNKDISGLIMESNEDWVQLVIPMRFEDRRRCVTVVLPRDQVDEFGNDIPEEDQIPWSDPREEPGELMWPDRFSEKEVRRIETALGPVMSSGRLQQSPVPAGGAIIKRDWWLEWGHAEAAKYGLEWYEEKKRLKEFPDFEFRLASLDTAFGEKEENDYSALTVWGVWMDRNKNPRVMMVYAWAKRLPLHGEEVERQTGEAKVNYEQRKKAAWGLVEQVADTCRTFKVDRLLIENKARGYDVAKEINRLYAREKWMLELINPVKDKVARAHAVVPIFADGVVWAPNLQWSEDVINQCMVAGTMIITDTGVKTIEEVCVGDYVLTHKGRFRPVISTFRRHADKIVRLEGKSLDPIELTPEHPVHAFELDSYRSPKNDVSWVKAGDVKARLYRDVVRDGKKYSEAYPSECHALVLPVIYRETPVDEIDLREWASVKTDKEFELISDEEVMTSSHVRSNTIKWRQKLDYRFGRVIGLYLAEGCCRRSSISWSFNTKEVEFIEEVSSFVKERLGCGVGYDVSTAGTCTSVRASLSLIEPFFREFGRLADGKFIPAWIWDAPDEFLNGIITGYMDGDGHKTNGGWSCVTVSQSLAWGIRLICLRIGKRANLFIGREPGEGQIGGRWFKTKRAYIVSFLDNPSNDGSSKSLGDKYVFSVMKKINIDANCDVYNLEVAEDNSYCTTGGIVHNCSNFPKDDHDDMVDSAVQALLWLRDNGILVRGEEVEAMLEDEAMYRGKETSVAEFYNV